MGTQLSGATGLSTQLASMLISIAPILLVYPFFQKHFVHGVMIGAVKG
jgi:putative aldouronate transport system permease protein